MTYDKDMTVLKKKTGTLFFDGIEIDSTLLKKKCM